MVKSKQSYVLAEMTVKEIRETLKKVLDEAVANLTKYLKTTR